MKVIHLFDRYKPRQTDEPATAIRRLLLRRKFQVGERVSYHGDEASHGVVLEVDSCYVRVLWNDGRSQWHDTLDVLRIVQNS